MCLIKAFHVTNDISCLKALALLVWIYLMSEEINERNLFQHLSRVTANYFGFSVAIIHYYGNIWTKEDFLN
jgi:F0F1-type ATP synthase membrane subunit a